MYVAMATAVHMDYTFPLNLISNAFVNTGLAYVGYYIYTSDLQKHGALLKYCS